MCIHTEKGSNSWSDCTFGVVNPISGSEVPSEHHLSFTHLKLDVSEWGRQVNSNHIAQSFFPLVKSQVTKLMADKVAQSFQHSGLLPSSPVLPFVVDFKITHGFSVATAVILYSRKDDEKTGKIKWKVKSQTSLER